MFRITEKVRENDIETEKLLNPSHDHHHHHEHSHDHHHEGKDDKKDDEMEQEDMYVMPDAALGHDKIEWGGPRRGGRFSEPTRFGDWERKGRCTDF